MPTVATKNGGPVDIMATLHHGLLVDPTNSKQIADALLKILTNPEVWDVMSHNGAPPPLLLVLLPGRFDTRMLLREPKAQYRSACHASARQRLPASDRESLASS